ncbi:hypothetical protein pipiens_019066 [Culex pipiens pipiens]|uniref:Dynein heavy chain n=1 Tax=Culex pipiens pipiens TaxID=38569 RepID=A0ABD1DXB6_CULPP
MNGTEVLQQLTIHMANARFYYGFEYLGVQGRQGRNDTSARSTPLWITSRSGQYCRTFQLERFEGTKGVAYVIDPKAMTKEALYGVLVGACNPPTNPGPFAGTPNLSSQDRFTQDTQPHYVNSPREMTRWVRGICEAIRPPDNLAVEGLVRLWAHEALRLHRVNLAELRDYVKARLKVFYEEELDVPLVLFDEVLEHVQRIDFIFRQPQGHLLLIGVPGAGNTMRSRFVD